MLNCILTIWLHPYQSPNQHGFWPGRGTLTAYRDLLTEIHNYRAYLSIFHTSRRQREAGCTGEFDLKSCFDVIQIQEALNLIVKTTTNWSFPQELINRITQMNQSLPRPGKDALALKTTIEWTDEQKAYDVLKYFGMDLTTISKEELVNFLNKHGIKAHVNLSEDGEGDRCRCRTAGDHPNNK
uniref:Uncharacterized protein n=1 Tax=Wolfiporia cocos TaxID=81056 RepID=A0A7G7YDV2_9APHY|nr:hypothetical protein [Wolfiporia cocos]